MEHLNAVILAGGSGTRLWPLSTPSFPKQFLPLPNGRSMIQESLARIEPVVSPEHAWVVTGRSMAELVHEHLPAVPATHILGEPMGRNTSAAIAWAAATIAREDAQATMIIVTADHVIRNIEAFNQALRLASRLAEQGHLVTLGIRPTAPETGFGYILYAEPLTEGFDHSGVSRGAFRRETQSRHREDVCAGWALCLEQRHVHLEGRDYPGGTAPAPARTDEQNRYHCRRDGNSSIHSSPQ